MGSVKNDDGGKATTTASIILDAITSATTTAAPPTPNIGGRHDDSRSPENPMNRILIGLALLILFVLIIVFVARKLIMMCRTWNEDEKADEADQMEAVAAVAAASASGRTGSGRPNEEAMLLMEAKKAIEAADNNVGSSQRNHCLNCNMIAMGEAVSYADGSCPQCGTVTK
jgi:hypothetical protein